MFQPRDEFNSWRFVAMSRDLLRRSRSPSEDAVRSKTANYIRFSSRLHSLAILFNFFWILLAIFLLDRFIVFTSQIFLLTLMLRKFAICAIFFIIPFYTFWIYSLILYRIRTIRTPEERSPVKGSRADRNIPTDDCFLLGSIHREVTRPIDAVLGTWGVLQLIGHPVELSGTTTNTHDIFRTFSLEMIKSTGSLSPLLIAAMHGCSGQPSWVADWSAAKRGDWKSYVAYFLSSRGVRWLMGDLMTPFTIDNDRGILHIFTRGSYSTLHIARLQSFLRVSTIYNEQEKEAHLHNIKCLVACLHGSFDNSLYEILPLSTILFMRFCLETFRKEWPDWIMRNGVVFLIPSHNNHLAIFCPT